MSPTVRIWLGMLNRCKYNRQYTSKGITVCDKWANSYDAFFRDMGERPSLKHSIDRIDNDGNYEPSNCRWATQKTQMRNTSRNVYVEYNGQPRLIADLAEEHGVPLALLHSRLSSRGWPIERALSVPPKSIPKASTKNKRKRKHVTVQLDQDTFAALVAIIRWKDKNACVFPENLRHAIGWVIRTYADEKGYFPKTAKITNKSV